MLRPILSLIVCCGLSAAASAQPQIFYQRYQSGRAQLDSGQFAAAAATLKAALDAAPMGQAPDPNIYVALGYAQMRTGRLAEANATFNLAQGAFGSLTPTSQKQLQVNRQVLQQLLGH